MSTPNDGGPAFTGTIYADFGDLIGRYEKFNSRKRAADLIRTARNKGGENIMRIMNSDESAAMIERRQRQ